jgi:HEAT repeat protein
LGNVPSERGRAALLKALSFDPSSVVREAAAWSLAQAHGADQGVRPALERAAAVETDPQMRAAILAWRDRCP